LDYFSSVISFILPFLYALFNDISFDKILS